MWFLWFYLISVGICIVVLSIIASAMTHKIKRKYPNLKVKKKSFSELVCTFLPFLIPFINLILIVINILACAKVINQSIEQIKRESEQNGNQ